MKITEVLTESVLAKFPFPKVSAQQLGPDGEYWGNLVKPEVSNQCFAMINKTLEPMIKQQHCRWGKDTNRGNLQVVADDEDDLPVLECGYDSLMKADESIDHHIDIEAGYQQHTQGLVSGILKQLYNAMEKLHGPGTRSMSINDDRGHGVWQHIAQKLGATIEH